MDEIRELFAACQEDVPGDVKDVCSSAADNAADTIGSRFVQGRFDDEFLYYWGETVKSILTEWDASSVAQDWFRNKGLKF